MEIWNDSFANRKLSGWLLKESHEYFTLLRKWQRRYFIFDYESKILSYYRDETLAEKRGQFEIVTTCGYKYSIYYHFNHLL